MECKWTKLITFLKIMTYMEIHYLCPHFENSLMLATANTPLFKQNITLFELSVNSIYIFLRVVMINTYHYCYYYCY